MMFSVSGVPLWSWQCVREREQEFRGWLQREIPWKFWKLFGEHLEELNMVHLDRLSKMNVKFRDGVDTTLTQWMSYGGAVRVWPGFPLSEAHWVDKQTGYGYVDCGPQIYLVLAKSLWPQAFLGRNAMATDDIFEAFCAFAWKCRSKGIMQSPLCLSFVDCLNNLCFARWLQSTMPVD
jgi:hypothetical protein